MKNAGLKVETEGLLLEKQIQSPPARNCQASIIKTNRWVKNAGLKVETEGLLLEKQNQSTPARNYQANIIKTNPIQYLACVNQKNEPLDNSMSSCLILTPREYKENHDKIEHYISWKNSKYYRIPKSEKKW